MADNTLTVTDGLKCWTALVVPGRSDLARADPAGWLLVFENALPPQGSDLWLVRSQFSMGAHTRASGVICFVSGTKIRTPGGAVPVETLRPGDQVITRDNGAQEVIWTGRDHISGARLYAMPHLRPVRICDGALSRFGPGVAGFGTGNTGEGRPDGDLLVSPGHRILVQAAAAQALFGADEVLVRAGDLIDDRRIRTDLVLREVAYHHILLARHEVLFANGVGADSFHPGEADLSRLATGEGARLDLVFPGVTLDPAVYGGYVRRGLTAAEAAILLYELRAAG